MECFPVFSWSYWGEYVWKTAAVEVGSSHFKEKIQAQTPKDYPFEIKATAVILLSHVHIEIAVYRTF